MAEKTYNGSCHCGKVRYKATYDFSKGTAKCNCTMCVKMRIWHVHFRAEKFALLSDPELLTDYQWAPAGQKSSRMHNFFCKHCGTSLFSWGDFSDGRYYGIQITTLDDIDPDELATAPVIFQDGRNDRFDRVPADVRLL
jgi:hypothetical protein